ncbi:MAG: hypothetical protein IPM64_02085 [Phycisphaerales bacterium]|nr:hypothetical protein [Phycisphaerales bacterium]
MRRFAILVAIGMVIGAGVLLRAGCQAGPPASFVTGVRSAAAVVLYEGLPHQFFEERALEEELASRATVMLHGFPFYEETLPLDVTDDRALRDIACASGTFSAVSGDRLKKCGGFHPDYCVEWRSADGVAVRMLVCLGCSEAKCCGPAGEVLYDIREAEYARLKAILTPYQKNRPPRTP